MNKITIAFFAGLILLAAGCRWGGIMGNGHVVTDTRSISDFSEIEADGGFQIEWRTGPPSLSITTDENLLRYISNENIDHRRRQSHIFGKSTYCRKTYHWRRIHSSQGLTYVARACPLGCHL